jgi:hypothetical protein
MFKFLIKINYHYYQQFNLSLFILIIKHLQLTNLLM